MAKKDKFDYFKQYKTLSELALKSSDILNDTVKDYPGADNLGEY